MSKSENLGDLLLQEDILSKILVYLVDGGLHEYRRVCRKWYEVCNKLPVKLSLSLHSDYFVQPDVFPNAVSLKLTNGSVFHSAMSEDRLLSCLSELTRITHLEFSQMEWPLAAFQQNSIATSVRSLAITVGVGSGCVDFLETLRCLTGLTALDLPVGDNEVIDVAPITELKQLRTLKACLCFIVNRNNEFIFGLESQLTKLEIVHESFAVSQSAITLKVMSVAVLPSLRPKSALVANLSTHRKSELSDTRRQRREFADRRL